MAESDLDPSTEGSYTPLDEGGESEISSLLAALNDPSPSIPVDVAARIDAAVAAEVLLRTTKTAAQRPTDVATKRKAKADTTSARPNVSRALFATAAAVAAVVALITHPWSADSKSTVIANGPTNSVSTTTPSGVQQRNGGTLPANPRETMMQVSRHAYQRSSLNSEVRTMLAGQSSGNQIPASAVPAQWRAVAQCAERQLGVLGASLSSKVDLGSLDGQPSAIVVTSDTQSSTPGTHIIVLQADGSKCTIAASQYLKP